MRLSCGHIVVVQNPFSCSPQLQVFSAYSISKAAKNVPLHCIVHSVALWNELMRNNALAVKEDFITFLFDLLAQKVCCFCKVKNLQYDDCAA